MKTILTSTLWVTLIILITGCGSQQSSFSTQAQNSRSSALTSSSCPLKFSQAGLCGQIKWTQGPSVDGESAFEVSFSKLDGESTDKLVEPSAQVGAFIRMTCCGSVFFPKVSKITDGKYSVSAVKFTPGKWEVYVQLKNGTAVEKQFININLDE